MSDAIVKDTLTGEAPPEAGGDDGKGKGDTEENGKVDGGIVENITTTEGGVPVGDIEDPRPGGEDAAKTAIAAGEGEDKEQGEVEVMNKTGIGEDGSDVGTAGTGGATCSSGNKVADGADGADDDDMYGRLQEFALAAINAEREMQQLGILFLDTALALPAMTHCRNMCEHDFLSHWDSAGRKPYQRYSDFAYGQHVSEVVFGFDITEPAEDEISNKIRECIEGRRETEGSDEGVNNPNHLLDRMHTHIGIGVCLIDGNFRYVEVYADRYLELLDAPAELSVAGTSSFFKVSVQMTSPDVGPYACLVFHDPVATPLTVEELQQQFSGPYSDFTESQVGVVWPWQMELLGNGAFDIPVVVPAIEAGTYYVQILVRGDAGDIPYDINPAGGLPLPGESFCGSAVVLRAPEETSDDLGISDLDGEGGLLIDKGSGTLEEKEARMMASTTALRRDLAPIVKVKVVQETGGNMQQESNYEIVVFMPPERAEDMAQINLGVHILRLGNWDDDSSRGRSSHQTDSLRHPPLPMERGQLPDETKETEPGEVASESKVQQPDDAAAAGPDESKEALGTSDEAGINEGAGVQGDSTQVDDTKGGGEEMKEDESLQGTDKRELVEGGEQEIMNSSATVEKQEYALPLVVTEILVATFGGGEKVEPPEGYHLLPGDLANPALGGKGFSEGMVVEEQGGEADEGKAAKEKGEGKREEVGTHERDKVFLCVKMAPYTDTTSPLTDLALVYGTEGFQMGFGFVTVAMPQAVNDLYGSTVHLCCKKEGASLAVIQQAAKKTAEKTAKQIQKQLGIEGGDGDAKDDSIEDEVYDVDTNMTPEQILEWEENRNREAAERADKREQVERERRRKEASEAVQKGIEEALKEKDELVKQNGDWQKKIASLMLTQQKTREEARTEHGGRGVEKEPTPVHESEKHYAESLAVIISLRERLQEQQAEYDTVAIALQTRLDEKEYKSREIADSFRDFKREIARTAEHSRTGKPIPKGVITQFEAAEAKKDEEIEKVRLKNINLRMMLKKVEGNLRAKEQLAEGLHLIDFEQLKIENQTVNEKIEERNEELLKLRKKNTTTVQILTHTKEKLQFVAAENAVTSHQLSSLEEDLNQERDCLTRAKKERDNLRAEVSSLRQSQGFANSDLLILDFEQRKLHLKKLGLKLKEMRSNHHLLILEQQRSQEHSAEQINEL